MILVILGTQNFGFNRLLDQIETLIENAIVKEEVIAQIGASKFESNSIKCYRFFERDNFDKLVEESRIIITHGGTGSIVSCLEKKKKVIVVPRLRKFKEHVDDHQMEITKLFADLNYIIPCYNVDGLSKIIAKIDEFKLNEYKPTKGQIPNIIKAFILDSR